VKNIFYRVSTFKYFHQCLLLLLVIIGFWQVSFFKYSMKWDMIDCYYPWRYMVGECLQNHILPLWNPYETLGYPIHADPQSGAWYPFAWIIGYLWGYNIYSIEFEFVLHVYIAAIGMYLLGKKFGFGKNVAFVMAVGYMFSGLIIGNSQHLTYVISAAWIPFILLYYLKFSESLKTIHALIAAFFMFMLLAGGYPAFSIVLVYFLFVLFIFNCINIFKKKSWPEFKNLIKQNSIFAIATVLFSAVILISVLAVSSFITRGNKLPLDMAMFDPFSPQCLISIILPYASIKDPDFFNTDLSMTNIYFGLILFLFLIISFFIKKPQIIKVFFWFGIFCLAAAMGNYLPIRKLLYDYIPMMGMFRFPSIFRLFTIISFVVTAGFALDFFMNSEKIKKKYLNILLMILAFLLIGLIAFSRSQGYLNVLGFLHYDIWKASARSSIWQHIVFQSLIQIGFLLLMFLLFRKVTDKKKLLSYIILLSVADLFFASQLNEPYTTYDQTTRAKALASCTSTFPKDFPVPSSTNIVLNTDTGNGCGIFWKNMNIYHKQIGWDGFTPFKFHGYEFMLDSMPGTFRSSLLNPPVYLTDKAFSEDSMKIHEKQKSFFHKNIYLKNETYSKISNKHFSGSAGDTTVITSFNPEEIKISVSSKEPQLLVLQQYYYTGWKAYVNEKETDINTYNKGLMFIEVPKGNSIVIFKYSYPIIIYAALTSAISLLIFVVFLILKRKSI
jgi:hypothetical protein